MIIFKPNPHKLWVTPSSKEPGRFDWSITRDDVVVLLDETAAATNMERRYGRAPRGQRCRIAVPHGHYKTTTVTAAPCGRAAPSPLS